MLTRIELTNFMSHVATVIEPAAGLTVLVGPNNCGKSAVVAALQLLCKNLDAKYAVRHGAKECRVQVKTNEGHTIVWRRKTAGSYEVNGQRFDRLGRGGVPETLHELLRLPAVGGEEGEDFDIHFGSQKSPIFLLNSSPATAARFFASSSDAIRLVEMQRQHKEKLADKQKLKNRLEAESLQLTRELEQLAPAVELDRRLKLVFDEHGRLLEAAKSLDEGQRAASTLAAQARVVLVQQAEHDALRPLASPPLLDDSRPLQSIGEALAEAEQTLQRAAAQWQSLAALPAPPPLFDVESLAQSCQLLGDKSELARRTEADRAALLPLEAPPPVADVAALQRLTSQLAAAETQLRAADARSASVQPLVLPPDLADAPAIASAIHQLSAIEAQVRREEQRLAAAAPLAPWQAVTDPQPLHDCLERLIETDRLVVSAMHQTREAETLLAATRAEFQAFTATEVCPTCGSPLDAERLLARAGVGMGGHVHG